MILQKKCCFIKQLGSFVRQDTLKQYSDKEWNANLDTGIITHSGEDGRWGHKAHHHSLKDYIRQRSAEVLRQLDGK